MGGGGREANEGGAGITNFGGAGSALGAAATPVSVGFVRDEVELGTCGMAKGTWGTRGGEKVLAGEDDGSEETCGAAVGDAAAGTMGTVSSEATPPPIAANGSSSALTPLKAFTEASGTAGAADEYDALCAGVPASGGG